MNGNRWRAKVVTTKPEKVRHLQREVGDAFTLEQARILAPYSYDHDPARVAAHKAESVWRHVREPSGPTYTIGMEDGVRLDAFPDISLRILDVIPVIPIYLAALAGKERGCTITEYLALHDGKRTRIFSCEYQGSIVEEPRGTLHPWLRRREFATIFRPSALKYTEAELPEEIYKHFWRIHTDMDSAGKRLRKEMENELRMLSPR